MMSGGLHTKNMYIFEHSMSLRDETRQVQSGELNTRQVEIKRIRCERYVRRIGLQVFLCKIIAYMVVPYRINFLVSEHQQISKLKRKFKIISSDQTLILPSQERFPLSSACLCCLESPKRKMEPDKRANR